MIKSLQVGQEVWFLHGGKVASGMVISEKTIDGFYSVAVPVGIPKLLKPDELFESKDDIP